ncbi:TrbC/VirB2 family protein [Janthinobacterium sp. FW305-128]|uniref:TrbC/VirB2 family protein n=1 Tax=Janthinobacterium sp. FW305-128 TaxID=2775055 RepID=UPI001E3552B4|nr:TrbC/VirB2 family protein [Janthinobacterium sp. FW305-128]
MMKSLKFKSANTAYDSKETKQAMTFAIMFALAICAVMPLEAMAMPWDSAGTRVLEMLTGGLSRTIAVVAVIACGIAALVGKLSWDWAIKIVIGIVLIFGAATIVDYFIGASS